MYKTTINKNAMIENVTFTVVLKQENAIEIKYNENSLRSIRKKQQQP